MAAKKPPSIPLPKSWTKHVRTATLHVISLAQYATTYTRSWAADSANGRIRIKAEYERAQQQILHLRKEMCIKDVRMGQISPHRRPYYPPTERIVILDLRVARGWSYEQTEEAFLVTAATIASWMKRLDEEGPDALVQPREPVNKFPEFVRYAVRLLKALCPSMGQGKIAQLLCRAGLYLGTTTVGRMLKENPKPASSQSEDATSDGRVVTAKRPNHVVAYRSDGCAHRSRSLVQLATICLATILALLLVGSRRDGSLLQTRHGHHRVQHGTELKRAA